jgi:phosphatidylglycerol:prolipoprotein diacylglycerol transferase
MDFVAPLVPLGLMAGRIGNFINGELWGKVSTVPWAMVFPDPRAGGVPRHPSPLYEAFLEGLVLFIILWIFSRKSRPYGAISGLFLACYGIFRFAVEFVRLPDEQIGYLAFNWVTMGQLLSAPMALFGIGLVIWSYRGTGRHPT